MFNLTNRAPPGARFLRWWAGHFLWRPKLCIAQSGKSAGPRRAVGLARCARRLGHRSLADFLVVRVPLIRWVRTKCIAATVVLLGCSGEGHPGRQGLAAQKPSPNVLIVTFDTTRADAIDIEGQTHTPHWAHLASQGVWFQNAFTATPITLPSHASLLTGLLPMGHGVRNNGGYVLDKSRVSLAETARAHGYSTAAFVSAEVLSRRYGLDQGFDEYNDLGITSISGKNERSATAVTDAAIHSINAMKSPWFVWVHYFDPHATYAPPADINPPAFDNPKLPPDYAAEIYYADRELGRLLKVAGGALIVATADHGESLGEHGEPTHGFLAHDSTLRVPMVWSWPGQIAAGKTSNVGVQLIDVVPTIHELLGWEFADAVHGVSLTETFSGGQLAQRDTYAETYIPLENLGLRPLFALTSGELRLVRTTRDRLWNLADDPGETREISASEVAETERLGKSLDAFVTGHGIGRAQPERADISAAELEKLAALGYMHIEPVVGASLDIYDNLAFAVAVSEAARLGESDKYGAYEAFLRLSETYPTATDVWDSFLPLMVELGVPGDCQQTLRGATANPEHPPLVVRAAWCELRAARPDESARWLQSFHELAAGSRADGRFIGDGAYRTAAKVSLDLARDGDALLDLNQLANLEDDFALLQSRALLRHGAGDLAGAVADYRDAVRLSPDDPHLWRNFGYALAGEHSLGDAAAALRKSLTLDPTQIDLWARLARVEAENGRSEQRQSACKEHLSRGGRDAFCVGSQ